MSHTHSRCIAEWEILRKKQLNLETEMLLLWLVVMFFLLYTAFGWIYLIFFFIFLLSGLFENTCIELPKTNGIVCLYTRQYVQRKIKWMREKDTFTSLTWSMLPLLVSRQNDGRQIEWHTIVHNMVVVAQMLAPKFMFTKIEKVCITAMQIISM